MKVVFGETEFTLTASLEVFETILDGLLDADTLNSLLNLDGKESAIPRTKKFWDLALEMNRFQRNQSPIERQVREK